MTQLTSTYNTTSDNNEINNTFKLLEEGEEKIELSEQYKNVTLVLGNTGAGKSTFIQWMAGDNNKLISKEVGEGTGEFIIEDGNRIGSSINSKTLFPELVVDSKTNAAYYDCPGFSDTRSTSYDIAATYFIKKLADHAKNVKIVLVVGYPAVRKGVERQDFIQLMRHATDLIKNIRKFQNSIAIAITKVDNQTVKRGKVFSLVPDEKIIETIAGFLQEVKQGLEDKLKITDIANEEKIFCSNAIKLVNVLRTKNNKNYTRIGIFRRPDELGPLSNITLLQQGKKHIEKILYEELKFTKKSNNDFGYTISEKSKNDINILVEKINDKVWADVSEIVDKIQNYYSVLIEEIHGRINSFIKNTEIVHVRKTEAQAFSTKLNTGHRILSGLSAESKNITNIKDLVNKTESGITLLGIDTCIDNIKSISIQGNYFEFLQVVSDRKLNTRSWSELFHRIAVYLSGATQNIENSIYQAAEKINETINHHTKNIAKEIEEYYLNKMESLEIEKLPVELNKGHGIILNLIKEINNLSSAQELSNKISDSMIKLNLATAKVRSSMLSVLYHGKYLEFLKFLNNGTLDTWSSAWFDPFNNTEKYLADSEAWYKFLGDLYARFSKFSIQKDVYKYNVANINDWGHQHRVQGIKITKDTFRKFLEKIEQHDIAEYSDIIKDIDDKKIKLFLEDEFLAKAKQEYDIIRNIEVTESRLQILNHVLKLTLDYKIDTRCPELDRLIIRGDYIKFSDFIGADGKIVDLCRNGVVLSAVDVFALNAIFIDKDLQEIGSRLQVSIVAPRWQVIGARTINLDGAPGIPYPSKAEDGRYPGGSGSDGLPGLPGGAAGNFLGIGKEFIYSRHLNLTITTNGGQGGPGQQGGNGAAGGQGELATKDDRRFKRIEFGKDRVHYPHRKDIAYNIFYGRPGGSGNGGNGGVGGSGGINGSIKILKLDGISNAKGIMMSNLLGNSGIGGQGGDPGEVGINGNSIISMHCYEERVVGIKSYHDWCGPTFTLECSNGRESAKGSKGHDSDNYSGKKAPEEVRAFQSIFYVVSNYKNYLRENLKDNFKKHDLMQFINQLDSNVDIKNSYDTLGLVSELQDLEKQFHSLHQAVDFMPFYQSLLNRTSEYAQHPKHFENSKQYKKVLGYLYTTTLSRISTLKTGSEPNLIIDLENYLDWVKQNINSLARLQETSNKFSIINQYKDAYKTNIDKKIEEAKYFITNQVTPEIDNINTQVEHKIDSLISETIALQKQARKEKEQLVQKKRELEKALIASWIFSGLKIFGQVVGCFGKLGAAVGSVIGSASQVAESLSLAGQDSGTTLQLPNGVVQSIQSTIVVLKNQKFTRFKKLLENISTEVNKHPEKLSDTSAKVKKLITSCQAAQNNSDVNKIKELEKELKQELTRKASALKNQKGRADKKIASATAVITKFNQAIQFGAVGFDIYSKYGNDKQKVETIDEAIKQAEGKIQQLEKYETTIYETITPMLKNMGDDLNNVASQLNNKSQVFLDVTQWQVQSFLKDIKLQMRQFTKGFTIEDNLARCIEKLEETVTTLINIYDRIQNYQEQQQLAVYMADISSPTANHIGVTNQTLNNAVNELEIIIRSNLVVEQYQTAVNALTQQVFPFAHRYLAETRLPSLFQSAGDFQGLVSTAVKQVESMQSKITAYKTAIKQPDAYISSGWFNRDYVSAQPFFVWENSKHQDAILKLLSGDKVVVKANILNSPFEKDAIKFNKIAINFYSENSTMTSEVSNKLKGFTVSATHLGNSYYRYNNNIYIITSDSQNIQFSFERDAHGEPVQKNSVYDKIKSGDLMLSPYAMWEIQIINATNKIHFRELTIYKDKVNLELVGHGSYVTRGTNISDTDIENYYKAVETISASALSDDNQQELPISNITQAPETLPTTSTTPPAKKSAHRHRHHHPRSRRQLPDISSSASRPTPWITRLWQGLRGILADTNPRLPQTPDSPATVDYTAHHLQGGLQLLDLVIRKWTGKKYSPPAFTQNVDDQPRTAAAELAYAAYCPRLPKLQQSLTAEIHESHAITPQELWLAYPLSTTDTHPLTHQLT
ncbi:MAG: hypothetical protein AB2992_07200 (plasmid) [Candidatus Symbiodolus clandestinus]